MLKGGLWWERKLRNTKRWMLWLQLQLSPPVMWCALSAGLKRVKILKHSSNLMIPHHIPRLVTYVIMYIQLGQSSSSQTWLLSECPGKWFTQLSLHLLHLVAAQLQQGPLVRNSSQGSLKCDLFVVCLFICVRVCAWMCPVHVVVREQCSGVTSSLPTCGSPSGTQAGRSGLQVPIPAELSLQPSSCWFLVLTFLFGSFKKLLLCFSLSVTMSLFISYYVFVEVLFQVILPPFFLWIPWDPFKTIVLDL